MGKGEVREGGEEGRGRGREEGGGGSSSMHGGLSLLVIAVLHIR